MRAQRIPWTMLSIAGSQCKRAKHVVATIDDAIDDDRKPRLSRRRDILDDSGQAGLGAAELNIVPCEIGLHGHRVPAHASPLRNVTHDQIGSGHAKQTR